MVSSFFVPLFAFASVLAPIWVLGPLGRPAGAPQPAADRVFHASTKPKGDDPVFDWAGHGKAFLSSNPAVTSAASFDDLLVSDYFAHLELGSFELYIPVERLQSVVEIELLQEFSLIVVDLQSNWHRWRATDLGSEAPEEDWKALRKWVEGWKAKKLVKLTGGPQALNEKISGGDRLIELQARLAKHTQPNPAMETYVGKRNKIVFAPTRRDFIDLLAAAGILVEEQTKFVWDDANLKRTAAWVNWVEVLCFEEAGYPFDINAPFQSQSMNRDEPTARTEFIADRMVLQLLRKEFYPNGTHFFELSLGTNLVVETLGYNNTRAGDWSVSYKTAGGQTQAYERFVPGGNSAGGVLPARRAVGGPKTGSAAQLSRYRKDKGENFFHAALKQSQKDGAKLVKQDKDNPLIKNKLAHFVLHSFESSSDTTISAPFLGPLADAKKLPANEFIDDYEDFFRAYRSGFFHWLTSEADADPAKARELFSALIAKQSSRQLEVSFDSVIESVYGLPLSAADDSVESLEWRYLDWLKKSK